MIVDAILKPGIALRVGSRLTFQYNGTPVRKDQPVPDEQYPTLAEAHIIAVLADDAGALGDQEHAARRTVIDVLGDLRGDLSGQIGANAGDERGRNHGPGL